jgi:tetratricopeptide (TPR) repeat protein
MGRRLKRIFGDDICTPSTKSARGTIPQDASLPLGRRRLFKAELLSELAKPSAMSEHDNRQALALIEAFRSANRPRDWAERLPENEGVCRSLAAAFDPIGSEAYNEGDMTTAYDAFLHLFMLRLKLVKANNESRQDIRDFASAEDLLGRTFLQLGDLETAEQLLGEALSYRQGLYDDDRDDAHAAYLYGLALWHMSGVRKARGEPELELTLANQARDHLVNVDERWPGVSFILDALADINERLS